MKTIRRSCFETNSSSSHSISISESKLDDTIDLDKNGNIVLEGGEFGWGYEKYNDAYTKACYCAVDFNGSTKKIKQLKKVIKKHTGANNVIFSIENSYIDHQSVGTAFKSLDTEDEIAKFIFCKNSVLIIDNDNR